MFYAKLPEEIELECRMTMDSDIFDYVFNSGDNILGYTTYKSDDGYLDKYSVGGLAQIKVDRNHDVLFAFRMLTFYLRSGHYSDIRLHNHEPYFMRTDYFLQEPK